MSDCSYALINWFPFWLGSDSKNWRDDMHPLSPTERGRNRGRGRGRGRGARGGRGGRLGRAGNYYMMTLINYRVFC